MYLRIFIIFFALSTYIYCITLSTWIEYINDELYTKIGQLVKVGKK